MAVVIDLNLCIGCGNCASLCMSEAIDMIDGHPVVTAKCISCAMCVDGCPVEAIRREQAEKTAGRADEYGGVWVYAETDGNTALPVVNELLGKGSELARNMGEWLTAVYIGNSGKVISSLAAGGADRVIAVDCDRPPEELLHAHILSELIRRRKPAVVLCGATPFGRTLAPRVAATIGTGLTADCTILETDPVTKLLKQTRPAFGGNLMATIVCENHRPQMATVRPGVMKASAPDPEHEAVIERETVATPDDIGVRIISEIRSASGAGISTADLLVVAGRGVGEKKNMRYVRELAEKLGGDYGVSRPLVDMGWATYDHQVGQTGLSVSPKVLISLGVSGAIQHLAGIGGANTVIAVNTDPNAPIFGAAKYAVVGDCVEFMKQMIQEIDKSKP